MLLCAVFRGGGKSYRAHVIYPRPRSWEGQIPRRALLSLPAAPTRFQKIPLVSFVIVTDLCASLLLGTRAAAARWPGLSPRSQRLPLTSLGPSRPPRFGSFLSDTQCALAPPVPREGPPAAPHPRAAPSLRQARGRLTAAPPVRTSLPLSVETKPFLVLLILVLGQSRAESVLRPPKIPLDETQAPWK